MFKNRSFYKYFLYNLFVFLFLFVIHASFNWAELKNSLKSKNIIFSDTQILDLKVYKQIINNASAQNISKLTTKDISRIIEAHPYVLAARVSNQYPNKILVEIIEREPLAILKINPLLMIDGDGIILPDLENYVNYNIPILSNFNFHETSHIEGKKISSDKVIDCVEWLKMVKKDYNYIYENLSELKITSSDEIELILFDRPTYIYLGLDKINSRLKILKKFEETIKPNKISDYTYLDLRYKNQIIVKEKRS
jgi:cell division protein FtsQ